MRRALSPLCRACALVGVVVLLVGYAPAQVATLAAPSADADDYDIPGGHFYRQTASQTPDPSDGYPVTGRIWEAFQQYGGVSAWGYPVGQPYQDSAGRSAQAFQKGVFQIAGGEAVSFANVFDLLSGAGKDAWLESTQSTPRSFDWSSDAGKPWAGAVSAHLAILEANPAIKRTYTADPLWLEKYGLPMAIKEYEGVVVVRGQRAVFQQWKVGVPWAAAGQVVIANGGDVAKSAGVLPGSTDVAKYAPSVWGQAAASTPTPVPARATCPASLRVTGSAEFRDFVNGGCGVLASSPKWSKYVYDVTRAWQLVEQGTNTAIAGGVVSQPRPVFDNIRQAWTSNPDGGYYALAELMIHEATHMYQDPNKSYELVNEPEAHKVARQGVCEIARASRPDMFELFGCASIMPGP